MRNSLLAFFIYVIVHSAQTGDYAASYQGISEAQITSMLTDMGRTGDFVTLKQYQQFITDHPYVKQVDAVKEQAKTDLNNAGKTDKERINSIIKYLDLDK